MLRTGELSVGLYSPSAELVSAGTAAEPLLAQSPKLSAQAVQVAQTANDEVIKGCKESGEVSVGLSIPQLANLTSYPLKTVLKQMQGIWL